MDIKDIILIGGGLLIAAVIAHGFWIAWRARRDPLRIDLVKDLPGGDDGGDDIARLRAELPNGGARVVGGEKPRQASLELGAREAQAPLLLDPSERTPTPGRRARTEPRAGEAARRPASATVAQPTVETDPAETAAEAAADAGASSGAGTAASAAAESPQDPLAAADDSRTHRGDRPAQAQAQAQAQPARGRGRVADVIMPERPIRGEEPPKEPRRWSARRDSAGAAELPAAGRGRRPAEQSGQGRVTRGAEERPAASRTQEMRAAEAESRSATTDVDELIMLNVLAPKGQPFTGGGMVEALRARGLRYGDMNIFHRVDPMTKATLYSVANVVEPGTFDMADLDNFRSPGVVFFMQLPGPEQPMDTFEDMLKVARDVAVRTGGSLLDENRSVMTGQTVEHYRQRITDYCRRRMSMRA